MAQIDNFRLDYFFLSNFYPCKIAYDGMTFPSVEAAFQAAKTLDKIERVQFQTMDASTAKRVGRRVKLRPDWESVKIGIMRELVACKFLNSEELRDKLIATGDAELIEGNTWGDRFWGVCNGSGRNELGRILMEVRSEIVKTKNGH